GLDLHGYNLGASMIWLLSYDFNLMLEVVSINNEEINESGQKEWEHQLIINPGFRWAVYTEGETQFVLALAVPSGLTATPPDTGISAYMSIEHAFRKLKKNGKDG